MATWVNPIDSQTDPDAPLTSELGKRWDNNVVAALELDASAPKMKVSVSGGTASSASALTVSGLSSYDGAIVSGSAVSSSSGACNISLSLSSDGVSFSTPVTVIAISSQLDGSFNIFVDKVSGTVTGWYGGTEGGFISETLNGAGAGVSHIRVSLNNSNHAAHVTVQRVGEII